MGKEEMIAFAYSECGLSIEGFFGLSWYEWSLEVLKVRRRNEHEYTKWEGNVSIIREFMAMFYNANRGHNPAKTGKELMPLSIDKPEVTNTEPPSKDILAHFPKSLKNE